MAIEKSRKLSASLEDYLEAIFNLADDAGGARSKDIAASLGVARSSVTGALQLLCDKGLASHEPYGCVTLTARGEAAAREVAQKHDVLASFFADVLGVEREMAQRAACQAEHALGPEIIGRLLSFIEYVAASGRAGRNVASEFRLFHGRRSLKRMKGSVQ
ncbi:MAG TPA: metal-dependent transcriptional regulator [Sedimentisphaerales bacterium]|jgi:DtxR family Mn-dependent transcriptional regulator|nr:metal-dependent transcriptional regulator [Sedimentisphaerales bacterium]HNU31063.1 metal-dependent transcriptional regulator [Sedimentisphaerales bacterium]